MKRILLMATTMLFAVLVVGGVAYALTFTCDTPDDANPVTGQCLGTSDSDNITGTTGDDTIDSDPGNDRVSALAGNDTVLAGLGRDRVFLAEGIDTTDGESGNDVIHGGPGDDGRLFSTDFSFLNLEGAEDSDVVYGEEGDDLIDAAEHDTAGSVDRSIGGAGNDQIYAADGNVDRINCGAGGGDQVILDAAIDTARNCESNVAP